MAPEAWLTGDEGQISEGKKVERTARDSLKNIQYTERGNGRH